MLVVNININSVSEKYKNFPIFAGKYSDFTPDWYSKVGATIAFTMILNIITPHLSSLMLVMIYNCKRYLDRKCSGERISGKVTKADLFSLYVGPTFRIDSRYSQVNILNKARFCLRFLWFLCTPLESLFYTYFCSFSY